MTHSGRMSESTARISAATLTRRLGPVPDATTGPAYRLLANRIRGAVLDGRLAVSSGLPSERDLAAGLALSRTTVAAGHRPLREGGGLVPRGGSGGGLRLREAGSGSSGGGRHIGPAGLFGHAEKSGHDDI